MYSCSNSVRTLRNASLAALAFCLLELPVFAGVTVTQNTGPGATSWPGAPLLQSLTNPSSQATVGEGFSGATSYTETFTILGPDNYSLQTIAIYAGGGSGTTSTSTVTLNLYDLGAQVAPNPNGYSAGVNLLGSGGGLPVSYVTQTNGLLRFDFTGSDQVLLLAGHLYAFELAGVSGTNPITWYRSISDTYSGGAAYRSRSWINGNNARDFALALYGVVNNTPPPPPPPTTCTVDATLSFQKIDGFGAGAVFLDAGLDPLTDATMDALYGTGPNQMALTLLRVRISPFNDWTNAILDGQKATLRGARVLATPWTPPAAMKDNNNVIGGSLLPAQYGNFVDYLNSFTDIMAANGAPVAVVSIQNEADFTATYESSRWSAAQFRTFFHDFAAGIKVPVMMPESFSFDQSLSDATLGDPASAANVRYVGGHLYGGTIRDYPLAHSEGIPTWMTEFLINDQTIGSAVSTAQQISDCLTVGNMSAYIWWKTIGDANGLLNAAGVLQPRAYVMSQFSRFVHPGDIRIGVVANTSTLSISAFESPSRSRATIVVVNTTLAPLTHTFSLKGILAPSVTPVITSATRSLEPQAPVAVSGNAFTYTIPATSVVTFVTAPTASVSPSGFVYNRRTGRVVQQVTLTNTTESTISGPIYLELTGLSSNTSLINATGGAINPTVGSPYITVSNGDLDPGATLSVTLEFTLPASGGIIYTPRTITGIAIPPLPPIGLTAAAGNTQVSLSWTPSSGATSYNVKRATISGGPYTTIANVTSTAFVNTGPTNGTIYYYVVSALNSGEGINSSQVSATPGFGSAAPLVYSVENTGASFPQPPLPTVDNCPTIPALPDPFAWANDPLNLNGTRSTSFSDWSHHRAEIKAQIENYEIGTKPAVDIPSQVTASFAGNTLTVNVTANGQTLTLNCAVSIPPGATAPYPVCIGMADPYGFLTTNDFTSRGIISVVFSHDQVTTYNNPQAANPFYRLYPSLWGNSGQYSAWAWGVSRIIDGLTLVQDSLPVDLQHICATGCSYAGKMALFSGALDERIALTIAQESGGGGDTSWRFSATEPPGSVEGLDQTSHQWFRESMFQFAGINGPRLPEDHHMLMALCAPRALYCTGNTDFQWLSNRSAYVCGQTCAKIYSTLGIADRFGFNVDGGHQHCAFPADQEPEVQYFLDTFMKGQATVSQTIRTAPSGYYSTIDYARWSAWWGTTNPVLPP